MNTGYVKLYLLCLLLFLCWAVPLTSGQVNRTAQNWAPRIPKTWVDDEMKALELPLADPAGSPKHIPADYYYRIPVRPVYKTYPIYAPGREPAGYLARLSKVKPETMFDSSKLKTKLDWIAAGELV